MIINYLSICDYVCTIKGGKWVHSKFREEATQFGTPKTYNYENEVHSVTFHKTELINKK